MGRLLGDTPFTSAVHTGGKILPFILIRPLSRACIYISGTRIRDGRQNETGRRSDSLPRLSFLAIRFSSCCDDYFSRRLLPIRKNGTMTERRDLVPRFLVSLKMNLIGMRLPHHFSATAMKVKRR